MDMEPREFSGRERMLIDWMSVRNAMLRADGGEMKITYHKNDFAGGGIFGLTVEVELLFDELLPPGFTEDEKTAIDVAKKRIELENKDK